MVWKKIIYIFNKVMKFEFIRYVFSGGIGTIVDWSTFYTLAIVFGLYYQISLFFSFLFGTITHYTLNKMFTFKCKSKKITRQFTLYSFVAIIALSLSIFIMFILVNVLSINKMLGRILTTGIMLFINYSLHKNLSFSKKLFKKNDTPRPKGRGIN